MNRTVLFVHNTLLFQRLQLWWSDMNSEQRCFVEIFCPNRYQLLIRLILRLWRKTQICATWAVCVCLMDRCACLFIAFVWKRVHGMRIIIPITNWKWCSIVQNLLYTCALFNACNKHASLEATLWFIGWIVTLQYWC